MMKSFGVLVRESRLKQGLSGRKFAAQIGLSAPFLSNMERGLIPPPSEDKIKQMATVLGRDQDEFLAFCGRISSDIVNIILQDPIALTALIRNYAQSPAKKRKHDRQATEPLSPDFYPLEKISLETHTAVIGESGSGKSLLTRHLISNYFKNADVAVYDSDAKPNDWKKLAVLGRKANYEEIALGMLEDLEELQKRTELLGDGLDPGREIVRVVEEWPSTAAELSELVIEGKPKDIGTTWLRKLLRRGRKYRMKVFAVAQEFEVTAWKISGEGSLRRAFTVLYLGSAAFTALKGVTDKKYKAQLKKHFDEVEFPCLADVKGRFYPVLIPKL